MYLTSTEERKYPVTFIFYWFKWFYQNKLSSFKWVL